MDIIDITPVVSSHNDTLENNSTLPVRIILFLFLPLTLAGSMVYADFLLGPTGLGALISTFAIFVGFTINIMVLLITNLGPQPQYISDNLVKDLRYNTAFELLLGITILSLSLFGNFVISNIGLLEKQAISFALYFLVTNYILTLFLITRRLYVVIDDDLHDLA